jgi:SAM-dependent methyltransferase
MAELEQAPTAATTDCCSTDAQATCCEPGDKVACCGESAAGGSCGCSAGQSSDDPDAIREAVRARYAAAATSVSGGAEAGESCCAPETVLSDEEAKVFGAGLYGEGEQGELPDTATMASLGCGNPTAVAELAAGETVLDLGSGGGIDVLLSARRVGPTGKAYGLDMTDEMLALARQNQAKAGIDTRRRTTSGAEPVLGGVGAPGDGGRASGACRSGAAAAWPLVRGLGRHSTFYETPLEYLLDQDGIGRLVLSGQGTEQCILYSALDAYVRHFDVVIATDAVAAIYDDLGEAALKMMERNMGAESARSQDIDLVGLSQEGQRREQPSS